MAESPIPISFSCPGSFSRFRPIASPPPKSKKNTALLPGYFSHGDSGLFSVLLLCTDRMFVFFVCFFFNVFYYGHIILGEAGKNMSHKLGLQRFTLCECGIHGLSKFDDGLLSIFFILLVFVYYFSPHLNDFRPSVIN